MFLTDQICYSDMHKTGSVAVNKWLKELFPHGYLRHHEKLSPELIASDRIKFGTYRDPRDFYVSLWSYGCKSGKKSGPYCNLTSYRPFKSLATSNNLMGAISALVKKTMVSLSFDRGRMLQLYSDANDPQLFREWLKVVLDPKFASVLSGSYYYSGVYQWCGLYTWYMLLFYFEEMDTVYKGGLKTLRDFEDFVQQNCYIDQFLRTSHLLQDFKLLMTSQGLVDETNPKLIGIEDKHYNTSKSKKLTRSDFYNSDLEMLIEKRDSMICAFIDSNYKFES